MHERDILWWWLMRTLLAIVAGLILLIWSLFG